MRYLFMFTCLILLQACQIDSTETSQNETSQENSEEELTASAPDYQVALRFINDYADVIYNGASVPDEVEWAQSRNDVTKEFVSEIRRIVEEGFKLDPEMGLGFDPIVDAQDLPETFKIEREEGEYVIVQGVDWPDFELTMRLKEVDGKWFVHGCGIVNIPANKRMER
jgi:hypothetical protein